MRDLLTLTPRTEAHVALATFFSSAETLSAELEVREDHCFGEGWLSLGSIFLKPSLDAHYETRSDDLLTHAVRNGSYEWHTPKQTELLAAALSLVSKDNTAGQQQKLKNALIGLSHIVQRLGLKSPIFDPSFISQLPLKRSATIVADTNAVLQGGLNFASRNLSPIALLKIPAVVQMEITGWSGNYFRLRRDGKLAANSGVGLQMHMRSQGAQRSLIRLELSMQTDTERVRFGADPLRGIMQNDSDNEHKALNLQVVQQGFADRLIFETALQHLHASSPGHRVVLMTSDQGLARMCLSEGMEVAFYRAAQLEDFSETVLSGTVFNPFSPKLLHVPLVDILWELAVAFGLCRIRSGQHTLAVLAMGEQLNWTPYHANEDLLWVSAQRTNSKNDRTSPQDDPVEPGMDALPVGGRHIETAESGERKEEPEPAIGFFAAPSDATIALTPELDTQTPPVDFPNIALPDLGNQESQKNDNNQRVALIGADKANSAPTEQRQLVPAYKVSPATLLHLVQQLAINRTTTTADIMSLFHFTHERKVQEYRGFLVASRLVNYQQGVLTATERLDKLWNALRQNDFASYGQYLCSSEAMQLLVGSLKVGQGEKLANLAIRVAAAPGYICFAEMSGCALEIHNDGLYPTPSRPVPEDFGPIAYETYLEHARSEGVYIASGQWLESLAKKYGIHPLWSRQALEESRVQKLLERYVEGSTPDTRFAKHAFCTSEFSRNEISIKQVSLYEGDFLLPGKSSASLRLKRPS